MPDCNCTVTGLVTVDDSTIRVNGSLDSASSPCPVMKVALTFHDGSQTQPVDAQVRADGTWVATFTGFDPDQQTKWCDPVKYPGQGKMIIRVKCLDDDGREICDHAEDKTLECCPCPRITNLGFRHEDCQETEDGNFRLFRWRVKVDWPPDYDASVRIKLQVWRTSNTGLHTESEFWATPEDPHVLEVPPSGDPPLLLRADRDYQGKISIVAPELCRDESVPIDLFHVPRCECVAPPLPEQFFTVKDGAGEVVNDPNDAGCINGDRFTVHAAAPVTSWSATTDNAPVPLTEIDPQTVTGNLPADGSRVLVTALLTNGDCVHPVSISAKRCRPTAPPPDETPVEPPEPPVDEETTPPRIPWCLLWMLGALGLFLGGMVVFTLGWLALMLYPCVIEAMLAASIFSAGTSNIISIVAIVVIMVMIIGGSFAMSAGFVLLLLWVLACGGCKGKGTIPFCDLLKMFYAILMFVGGFLWFVQLGLSIAVSAASSLCLTPIWGSLTFIAVVIDFGAFALLASLTYYFGCMIGCFNMLSFLPLPVIKIPESLKFCIEDER